ncbi:membrane protein [Candidatus Magnetobacterium bavaricum]|uniref:Membrane protein n=1 Tax=Candidatus Magnetobacterium bavaricum TaxID=29290 RepID=A0A0F3GXG8_9BACT|nr:membrane protein [Candidatus Magnetobacterium bavaricum]
MLREEGFLVIFVIIAMLLFNWHFIGLSETVDGFDSFRYLFGVWAVVILLLFLISMSHKSSLPEDGSGNDDNKDSVNVDIEASTEVKTEQRYFEKGEIDKDV